jgi:hypothetical protein
VLGTPRAETKEGGPLPGQCANHVPRRGMPRPYNGAT